MRDIDKIKLSVSSSIKESLSIIDNGAIKIAIVVDENNRLLGTITDGDIRRAILKGLQLDDKIIDVYSKKPTVVKNNTPREEIIKICSTKGIYQVPVVDHEGKVVSIAVLDELLRPKIHDNQVILMVGGLGTRLKPLTDSTPKPMLNVGGKPILQTIVEKFAAHGFINIVMCVNYKSHIIQEHFGDGSAFGVNIEYILEDKRMGTAGALSLLKNRPTSSFFVMNGDLLTNINFQHLLDFHQNNSAMATMCVREYDFQVPYGVVNLEAEKILSIDEKPIHSFFVSAGIYLLNEKCIDLIPENKFYDMPTLFEKLIEENKNIISFPLREYWLDIGRLDEYEKANNDYHEVF